MYAVASTVTICASHQWERFWYSSRPPKNMNIQNSSDLITVRGLSFCFVVFKNCASVEAGICTSLTKQAEFYELCKAQDPCGSSTTCEVCSVKSHASRRCQSTCLSFLSETRCYLFREDGQKCYLYSHAGWVLIYVCVLFICLSLLIVAEVLN